MIFWGENINFLGFCEGKNRKILDFVNVSYQSHIKFSKNNSKNTTLIKF